MNFYQPDVKNLVENHLEEVGNFTNRVLEDMMSTRMDLILGVAKDISPGYINTVTLVRIVNLAEKDDVLFEMLMLHKDLIDVNSKILSVDKMINYLEKNEVQIVKKPLVSKIKEWLWK